MTSKRKAEWFDNDEFWETTYPFMFPESRFEEAPELLEQVLALATPKGKKALDLCCGPGRFAIALAEREFEVTAVDRTAFLLDKAKAQAGDTPNIEWLKMDMRDFVRPESYDLIINLFTSFGYFQDKNEDVRVLTNIHHSLRPGAVFVIDVMGKERLAKVLQPTTSTRLDDGSLIVQRHEVRGDWSRMYNEWLVIRDGRTRQFDFEHSIYSGQELRDRLQLAGFTDITLYGNLAGAPYGPQASRLIAVAHKPTETQSTGTDVHIGAAVCSPDERLNLHHLTEPDADALFQLVEANRAYLRTWFGWVDKTTEAEHVRAFIASSTTGGCHPFAIRWDGQLVGVIDFHALDHANRSIKLGYWLSEAAMGQGIVTRSCQAMVNHAFHQLQLNRVEICAAVNNTRSRAIAERLGFFHEGTLRDAEWLYDQFVDHVVYAMLRRDWPQQ